MAFPGSEGSRRAGARLRKSDVFSVSGFPPLTLDGVTRDTLRFDGNIDFSLFLCFSPLFTPEKISEWA